MTIKEVLEEVAERLVIDKKEIERIKKDVENLVSLLKAELSKTKTDADVFVGGSFAKKTLIRGEFYDVDIFVRFDWRYENISSILRKILNNIARKNKLKLEILHGSRDYFRIIKKNVIFEIIPVTKIKKPKEARNVTDLSYFHVNYVKKKLKKGNLAREVILAKQFCKSQKVYGAESYVNGFSGYALECLIINYNSFEKMLKELVKVKPSERVVIDPEGSYKKKSDVFFEMNESKLNSPIILVDPTWKERNALAALSRETFERFQEAARKFIAKPSKSFFVMEKLDVESMKKKAKSNKAEFVKIELTTNKQPGDIAGTKLKKFASYLEREIVKYFEIIEKEFEYNGENKANLYLIGKSKGEVVRIGPPADLEAHAQAFKKQNRKNKIYEKDGILHAKIKIKGTLKQFIKSFARKFSKTIKSMDVVGIRLY
ncbi:MAG: nucleotidyltransferase domain-containing protein [Candidatus Pacearchaeota archaeon]